jgi:prepilin-type N-terminal cleavage/methylation domain-containing protein
MTKPTNVKFLRLKFHRAFTMAEMLTVISIIVIVLAILIPTWNTLVGNSTIPNAQNLISVTLATARADALYNHQPMGVLFFVDPKTNQSAMAEVQVDGAAYDPTTVTPSGGTTPAGVLPSPSSTTIAQENGSVWPLELANYAQTTLVSGAATTSFNYYRDVVQLPAGVGVALNNNNYSFKYSSTNPLYQPLDRYVHFGVIMFDATGAVTVIPWAIPSTRPIPYSTAYNPTVNANYAAGSDVNQLGLRLGLVAPADANVINTKPIDIVSRIPSPPVPKPSTVSASGYYPLLSEIGIVLYDRTAYLSQVCGNASSTQGDNGAVFNELDYSYALPGQTALTSPPSTSSPPSPPSAPGQPADKFDEESWIDQNGIAMLVSPFNGEIIKTKQ